MPDRGLQRRIRREEQQEEQQQEQQQQQPAVPPLPAQEVAPAPAVVPVAQPGLPERAHRRYTYRMLDPTPAIEQGPPLEFPDAEPMEGEDTCSTCLEALEKDPSKRQEAQRMTRLSCSHLYHTQCIKPWMEQHVTCPMCRAVVRQRIEVPRAQYVYNTILIPEDQFAEVVAGLMMGDLIGTSAVWE